MTTAWKWIEKDGEVRVSAASPEGREQALKAGVPFLTKSYGPLREVEVVHESAAVTLELLGRIRLLEGAARALIGALPKCDQCEQPATHGAARLPQACVEHADLVPAPRTCPTPEVALPIYAPLRKLVALLGGGK